MQSPLLITVESVHDPTLFPVQVISCWCILWTSNNFRIFRASLYISATDNLIILKFCVKTSIANVVPIRFLASGSVACIALRLRKHSFLILFHYIQIHLSIYYSLLFLTQILCASRLILDASIFFPLMKVTFAHLSNLNYVMMSSLNCLTIVDKTCSCLISFAKIFQPTMYNRCFIFL